MKVTYKLNSGCTIEQEVRDTKQAFALVAYLQELFGVKQCGNCESPNVRLCYRTPQGYEYYSIRCEDCRHELKFGQSREDQRLFPKGWEAPYQSEDKPSRKQSRPQYHEQHADEEEYAGAAAGSGDGIPW